ncbi:MAG: hypothetical protein NWE99_02450 [Candidatus Bathyarchaeota archaeon]|nr:hypothetical protein [Candidatus Bathyarchaeota archaeon]
MRQKIFQKSHESLKCRLAYLQTLDVQLPYGSNYLDFTNGPIGGYFMEAYNHADSSTHYSSADTYWTGYGTSIDVLWTW